MAGGAKIRGITIEIGADTSKFKSALTGLNSSLRSSKNQLRDVDKLLKFKPGNTELLTQKQKLLGQQIKSTKEKLEELKRAEATMKANGVDESSEEFMALRREIISTEDQLKSLERQFREFGSVGAQQVAAVGEKLKGIGSKVSAAGKQLTTKVTLPIAIVGAKAAKSFAEVDKTMQLTNKTMGNSEKEAKLLSDAMKDAAANSTFGMSEAATATLNFARAGLSAEEAAAALAPAMNLAAGEGGNLDTVSAGLVATINGFGDSFEYASDYADVFANACNNSALDVDSLASSMSTAAPVFSAAGYTVRDAALYMGVMANAGIEASEGANALKSGFSRLVTPAKDAQEWLDRFEWSVTNADDTMKDTVTIQAELHDKFAELSEYEQIAAASAIFGKNQMSKWLALINTAPDEVAELSKALDQEGTTAEMAEAMMSGFGGSLEKLKSSIDVAVTSFGEALAPAISKVADLIQKAVDWFNGLTDAQKQTAAKVAVLVAAIGPVLLVVGKLITGVGALLTFAPAIAAAIAAINWPLVAVVAAVVAFIAIIKVLRKAWEEHGEAIKAKAQDIWQSVTDWFSQLGQNIRNIWNNIRTAISTAIENAKTKVQNTVNNIKSAVTNAFNNVKTTAANVWNGIRDAITRPIETAKSKLQGIVDGIAGIFNGLRDAIKLPRVEMSSLTVAGRTIEYPRLVWNARAMRNAVMLDGATIFGAMNGNLYGGGESGREIIVSYDKLAQMMGGGTTNINVVVNASQGMNERQLADMVAKRIQQSVNNRRAVWA